MNSNYFASKKISRRVVLRALMKLPLAGFLGLNFAACDSLSRYDDYDFKNPGLGKLAARQGKLYGAAVQSAQLDDAAFVQALQREVRLLVPEGELKWKSLRPTPDHFDFSGYRRLAAFAQANDILMRGHTLIWHGANPQWLGPALANRKMAEKIMRDHIASVLAETAPLIGNWDVVNEAFDPASRRADGLRETLWLKAIGPDYIPLAFHYAHQADPELTLVYNDYGFEEGGPKGQAKRQAFLRGLDTYLKDRVPIHALGLQSHLQAGRPLGDGAFLLFLKEVRARGLKIYVTELDLDLGRLSGPIDERIKYAQNYVHAYLNMIQESGNIDMLLTWGLSDKYSWLRKGNPDLAGALPLDKDFNRGALWNTLRSRWAVA